MIDVPTLYRSVECQQAVTNHLLGILWFQSLAHFRAIERPGRDSMEGIGSYTVAGRRHNDVADEHPVFPAFIMSFSEMPLPAYGKYVLKLSNPDELCKQVAERLPDQSRVR